MKITRKQLRQMIREAVLLKEDWMDTYSRAGITFPIDRPGTIESDRHQDISRIADWFLVVLRAADRVETSAQDIKEAASPLFQSREEYDYLWSQIFDTSGAQRAVVAQQLSPRISQLKVGLEAATVALEDIQRDVAVLEEIILRAGPEEIQRLEERIAEILDPLSGDVIETEEEPLVPVEQVEPGDVRQAKRQQRRQRRRERRREQ